MLGLLMSWTRVVVMVGTRPGSRQVGLSSALFFWGMNLKIMVCVCRIVCCFYFFIFCAIAWPSLAPCEGWV